MYKKYLYLISPVLFVFCLGCAEVIDSQHPTQAVASSGADSDVNQMQRMRNQMLGDGEEGGGMGMPPGVGPDLARMQEMRNRMYGGGMISENITSTPETTAPGAKETDESGDLLKHGKELFEAKQYQLAAVKLEAFLADHEYGDLTPEALYYLGESYYQQEKYKEAIRAFGRIDQSYPRYPLAPNAVYRMAKCYEKLGKPKSAQEILKQLKINHPQFDPTEVEANEP